MDLFDKSRPVLVAGAGLSGKGAAKMLAGAGYRVVLYDGNPKADLAAFAKEAGEGLVTPVTGDFPEELARSVSGCVISPGIPLRLPFVRLLREANVPVISEIAAAASFAKGKMAAVTGTNGKTTTTALTGHLLRQTFPDVRVVGNIGRAFSEEAAETTEDSLTVAELSSFQLELIDLQAPYSDLDDHDQRQDRAENAGQGAQLPGDDQVPRPDRDLSQQQHQRRDKTSLSVENDQQNDTDVGHRRHNAREG